jgi:hypothetical protein
MVYLVCDQLDREAIVPMQEFLFDRGCEVTLPATDGDEAELRKDHTESLLTCDAALIYAGRANELWLRAQLRELLKAPGYGRVRPLAAKAIYLASPDAAWKQSFRTHEAPVIRQYAEFAPAALTPFLAQLGHEEGGSR